jgi:hypothetical protein
VICDMMEVLCCVVKWHKYLFIRIIFNCPLSANAIIIVIVNIYIIIIGALYDPLLNRHHMRPIDDNTLSILRINTNISRNNYADVRNNCNERMSSSTSTSTSPYVSPLLSLHSIGSSVAFPSPLYTTTSLIDVDDKETKPTRDIDIENQNNNNSSIIESKLTSISKLKEKGKPRISRIKSSHNYIPVSSINNNNNNNNNNMYIGRSRKKETSDDNDDSYRLAWVNKWKQQNM